MKLSHKQYGKDILSSIEKKKQQKQAMILNQQEEIQNKIQRKKENDIQEMRSSLDEIEKTDLSFQIRELKLAQHH